MPASSATRRRNGRARPAQQAQDKVVALPRRDRVEPPAQAPGATTVADADAEAKVRAFSADPAIAAGLLAIFKSSGAFDPEQFMGGARQAYEMIVTAFAEGNRKTLRNLLSREVFEGFSAVISDREARGEQIDQSFVGITKAEIVEAELKGGSAQVSVRFVSDLISATRDKAGTVLSGDPSGSRK